VWIPSWLEADPSLHPEAVYIEADRFCHQKILLAIRRRTIHTALRLQGTYLASVSALAIMRQVRLLPADDGTSAYSVRNACIGSIRDALHAGTKQASAATTSSVAATAAKIAGSSGRVP